MDKQTYRQMDKKTKKTDRWIKRQKGQTVRQIYKKTDRQMDKKTNGQMDKKTYRQMDIQTKISVGNCLLTVACPNNLL